MYNKSEPARRQAINKLENDHESGGGFKPKQFKSSRSMKNSNQTKTVKSDTDHENAIFGSMKPSGDYTSAQNDIIDQSSTSLLSTLVANSTEKKLMHETVGFFFH